jgi:hypothetical protein
MARSRRQKINNFMTICFPEKATAAGCGDQIAAISVSGSMLFG